jgi:hypothetical protein
MTNIQRFDYNGQFISLRADGFINLTQMCQANGKRLDIFMKTNKTKEYIESLSNYHQIAVVYSEEGVNGGTWGHPTLAINLARWISPKFAVWCDNHIFNLMETGSTTIGDRRATRFERLLQLPEKSQISFIKAELEIAKEKERTKRAVFVEKEKTKQEALKTRRAEYELEETKILQTKKKVQYDRTILKISNDRQELKDKILEKINRIPSQSISSREVIQAFRRNKINNRQIDTAIVLDLFAELESEGFGRLIERRFILSEAYGEFEQLAIATCH